MNKYEQTRKELNNNIKIKNKNKKEIKIRH